MPEQHYMVDISEKLAQIKELIDDKQYFTINRGRQYGKTTTLSRLRRFLADEYTVISLSFEGFGHDNFTSEAVFCQEFLTVIDEFFESQNSAESWSDPLVKNFGQLGRHFTKMCKGKKVVLMIDEVDKASNYRVFLDFLNTLRKKYLARVENIGHTFHSVILVGVYDIKNIKLKMLAEGTHTLSVGEKEQNSPWNIAAIFEVDLSFSPIEISKMLADYEKDHNTGMNITSIAEEIHFYTKGYPVLVSQICWYLDTKIKRWDTEGIQAAIHELIRETDNELFKSLSQNLENHEKVRNLLYDVLILGVRRSFSIVNPSIDLAYRYGYIVTIKDRAKVSNKIFEMVITNYFVSKDEDHSGVMSSGGLIDEITRNDRFNMQLCLEKFQVHWQELHNKKEAKFMENQCRMIFLTYLKPILNGQGFYTIESALTDDRRMDLVVIYGKERFVLELKIWKGLLYNEKGVHQLLGYMDKLNEDKGYLLTFDFRQDPELTDPHWRHEKGKEIFEVRV